MSHVRTSRTPERTTHRVIPHLCTTWCFSPRPCLTFPVPPQIFDGYEKELLEFTASIARNTASLGNLDGGT